MSPLQGIKLEPQSLDSFETIFGEENLRMAKAAAESLYARLEV